MPSEWRTVLFRDAPLSIVDGDRGTNYPKQSDFHCVEHCLFLNAGNVTPAGFDFADCMFITAEKDSTLRKGRLLRHDIVLTTRGTVGNIAYFDESVPFEHVRINSGMVILRAEANAILPAFLFYFLRSPIFSAQIERLRSGTAQPQLPIRDINSVRLTIPPKEEQQAIVGILAALDARVAVAQKANETLEAIARAIFKSWFVDFNPVKAKAEGREPEGMDTATAALFPSEFQDSELGIIPSGWRPGELADGIQVNPARSLRKGEVAPYLDMSNVPTTGPSASEIISRPLGSGCKFVNGDTLLAKITPCLENGKTAFVDFLEPDEVGWGSTELIVLSPIPPVPSVFGYLLARDPSFRTFAEQSMTGTSGRQRVPPDHLKRFRMVFASDDIYKAFDAMVTPMFRSISANAEQMKTLASLRDTLLPRLISGKLRVPEAEEMLAEVV